MIDRIGRFSTAFIAVYLGWRVYDEHGIVTVLVLVVASIVFIEVVFYYIEWRLRRR